MSRLLRAFVYGALLASFAYAAPATATPITIGFYQGGFDKGGFVAGYFRAEDLNNDGMINFSTTQALYPSGEWTCTYCEVTDYFMYFSGNATAPSFTHIGLNSLALLPGGDLDNIVGISYNLQYETIPTWVYFSSADRLVPLGFIGSQDWSIRPDLSFDRGHRWAANELYACGQNHHCGLVDGGGWTTEPVHLFLILEPATLALLGLGLAGLGWSRRPARSRMELLIARVRSSATSRPLAPPRSSHAASAIGR